MPGDLKLCALGRSLVTMSQLPLSSGGIRIISMSHIIYNMNEIMTAKLLA